MCNNKIMANIGNYALNEGQQRLVEENMGLVYHMASKYGVVSEDLIQEGMLGLINAARFYSPEFGAKFSTYAGAYIWAALHGTYSDKKNLKKSQLTCSLDDPDLNLQPLSPNGDCGFFEFLSKNADSVTETVVRGVCEGLTKKEIRDLLNLSNSQLNSILNKVGRELYGERSSGKQVK